jgi:hypothetical protein
MPKLLLGTAAAAVLVGAAGAGLATGTAHGQVGSFPDYHWCPGDFWRPEWGFNWDSGNCHDDHHRDIDGPDHGRDWWG